MVLGTATYRVAAVSAACQGPRAGFDCGATEHLAYLRSALDAGAGGRMQELFPEGYFFTHVLYGLSWTELGARRRVSTGAAQSQAQWALGRLSASQGTAPFDPALRPAYGVFYAGWSLLLRSKLAALAPTGSSGAERSRIRQEADAISAALTASIEGSGSPFLQAYPGGSWPVDTVVAVAAMVAADAAVGADHRRPIRRWLASVPSFLDERTGLLPHRVDAGTGGILQGARGSSQSVIQRFWPAVDPDGAPASYRRYREQFLSRELGFVGLQEYPHGVSGSGDVDSGPLMLGMSLSASAVTIGAALANGDPALARELIEAAEVLGMPVTWQGKRRYAAGQVPVGDAFVVWARVTTPAPAQPDFPPVRALWAWWLVLPWLALLSWWGALYAVFRATAAHRSRVV